MQSDSNCTNYVLLKPLILNGMDSNFSSEKFLGLTLSIISMTDFKDILCM